MFTNAKTLTIYFNTNNGTFGYRKSFQKLKEFYILLANGSTVCPILT